MCRHSARERNVRNVHFHNDAYMTTFLHNQISESYKESAHFQRSYSISLLLFEAEVLPEAADGGLNARVVLIVGGEAFLPQSAGPGWA